ncbi:CdaR family protein [Mesoflavibacter sp. CH_XMU1404-2]|uniref:CdaR family protein n=1 Tax=Mesoflavibacter sp. CH_XMU1404-2 TaxID=3107766 RepID=UPI00300A3133
MSPIKNKISQLFKSKKLNVFVLFFIISLTILILSKLSQNYQGTLVFKVKPTNAKETQVILNDTSNQLKITLDTYGFKWLRYAVSKPIVEVDLESDVILKDSILIWTEKKGFSNISKQFGKDIKVININPDSLVFRYDINQVKKVPVKADLDVSFLQGFNTLDSIKVTPDSIKLIGPASLLKDIHFIKTKHKSFSDLKGNVDKPIQLVVDSISDEVKVESNMVQFHLEVSKFTEGVVTLPVTIVNVPEGIKINYFPKQITVKYATTINDFNSISEEDFKVECDYANSKNKSYLIPKIVASPKNVKNIRLQEQQIEFIITQQ